MKEKPKFNIGDVVWRISDGKAVQQEVIGVIKRPKKFSYNLGETTENYTVFFPYAEHELFATKQELIDSL